MCHICHKPGHIRPFCNEYHDFKAENNFAKDLPNVAKELPKASKPNISSNNDQTWKPRDKTRCYAVYVAFKTNYADRWYFDSGCSRHMTGNKDYLLDLVELKSFYVTYGGGAEGKILGKGTLNYEGFPPLKNVLLVDGLVANLISISQLCDDDLEVTFNKHECRVVNNMNVCIMTGKRSRKDNCYIGGDSKIVCNVAKQLNDEMLWHQKLGHVNYRNLENLVRLEAVKGLPKLKMDRKIVCGDCQQGKQTRVPHNVLPHQASHPSSTACFELLHMDLMGPIEVVSEGGMRYIYVIVDDFSRYSWVFFMKEKI